MVSIKEHRKGQIKTETISHAFYRLVAVLYEIARAGNSKEQIGNGNPEMTAGKQKNIFKYNKKGGKYANTGRRTEKTSGMGY